MFDLIESPTDMIADSVVNPEKPFLKIRQLLKHSSVREVLSLRSIPDNHLTISSKSSGCSDYFEMLQVTSADKVLTSFVNGSVSGARGAIIGVSYSSRWFASSMLSTLVLNQQVVFSVGTRDPIVRLSKKCDNYGFHISSRVLH